MYRVTKIIQSTMLDNNVPTNVVYYTGTDKAEALVALMQASLKSEDAWYNILEVKMEFNFKVCSRKCESVDDATNGEHFLDCTWRLNKA